MDYKIEELNFKNYQEFKKIYLDSFSKENRFSLLNLLMNVILKRAYVYLVIIEKEVVAFIYPISFKNERFILYLAVKGDYRNKGIGSYLLNWYLKGNNDAEVFLNIDEVNEKYEDYMIRQKRLEFYLKNNFYITDYLSVNGSSKGNILSTEKKFNIKKYKLLDKKISKWFFCKTDNIEYFNVNNKGSD